MRRAVAELRDRSRAGCTAPSRWYAARPLGRLVALANPFFQIESLYRFNAKFFPRWEPRYLVYDGRSGCRAPRWPRCGPRASCPSRRCVEPPAEPSRPEVAAGCPAELKAAATRWGGRLTSASLTPLACLERRLHTRQWAPSDRPGRSGSRSADALGQLCCARSSARVWARSWVTSRRWRWPGSSSASSWGSTLSLSASVSSERPRTLTALPPARVSRCRAGHPGRSDLLLIGASRAATRSALGPGRAPCRRHAARASPGSAPRRRTEISTRLGYMLGRLFLLALAVILARPRRGRRRSHRARGDRGRIHRAAGDIGDEPAAKAVVSTRRKVLLVVAVGLRWNGHPGRDARLGAQEQRLQDPERIQADRLGPPGGVQHQPGGRLPVDRRDPHRGDDGVDRPPHAGSAQSVSRPPWKRCTR